MTHIGLKLNAGYEPVILALDALSYIITALSGGLMPSHRTSAHTGRNLFCSDVIQLLYSDTLDDSVTKSTSLLFSQSKLITAASFLPARVCWLLIACSHPAARKHPSATSQRVGVRGCCTHMCASTKSHVHTEVNTIRLKSLSEPENPCLCNVISDLWHGGWHRLLDAHLPVMDMMCELFWELN